MSQCIEHLRSFDGYDNFSTDLAINRYDKNGLLVTFSGSSFRTADTCYQCTEPVSGKATTKQKITFCNSCWVNDRPKARLSILFHTEKQLQLSQSDTSSNSSFEELGSPMSSVTKAGCYWGTELTVSPESVRILDFGHPVRLGGSQIRVLIRIWVPGNPASKS